jgi:hypothetical protein
MSSVGFDVMTIRKDSLRLCDKRSRTSACWRQLSKRFLAEVNRLPTRSSKAYDIWRESGFKGIQRRIRDTRFVDRLRRTTARQEAAAYHNWIALYDTLSEYDREAINIRIAQLAYKPLISVVMPVYNVDEVWLRLAIESVIKQLYPHWELCIADDRSSKRHVRRVLEEYVHENPRIKVTFRETRGHVSSASNSALELANGDFVGLLDHDDELTEHALYMVAEELNAYPRADLIYSD